MWYVTVGCFDLLLDSCEKKLVSCQLFSVTNSSVRKTQVGIESLSQLLSVCHCLHWKCHLHLIFIKNLHWLSVIIAAWAVCFGVWSIRVSLLDVQVMLLLQNKTHTSSRIKLSHSRLQCQTMLLVFYQQVLMSVYYCV